MRLEPFFLFDPAESFLLNSNINYLIVKDFELCFQKITFFPIIIQNYSKYFNQPGSEARNAITIVIAFASMFQGAVMMPHSIEIAQNHAIFYQNGKTFSMLLSFLRTAIIGLCSTYVKEHVNMCLFIFSFPCEQIVYGQTAVVVRHNIRWFTCLWTAVDFLIPSIGIQGN